MIKQKEMIKIGKITDGYTTDHIKSECCNAKINFKTTGNGYSIDCWCIECGNYKYTGRIEGLLSLWLGKFKSVIKNKGYIPEWLRILNIRADK